MLCNSKASVLKNINFGRIRELILFAIWMPIGFTIGLFTDLRQIWIIHLRKPEFAWVMFRHDVDRLLSTLEARFPAGKTSPSDVLAFSKQQRVESRTYIGEQHITIRARAWIPSPWRVFSLMAFEWIVTFRFSQELIHISDNPSKNYLAASAILEAKEMPSTFQTAKLLSISARCEYVGV